MFFLKKKKKKKIPFIVKAFFFMYEINIMYSLYYQLLLYIINSGRTRNMEVEQSTNSYLIGHNIHGLLESLAKSVLSEKPDDVLNFLVKEVGKQLHDEIEPSTKSWTVRKVVTSGQELNTTDDGNIKMKIGVSNRVIKFFFPGDLVVDEPDEDGLASRLATDLSFGSDAPTIVLSFLPCEITNITLSDTVVIIETQTIKTEVTFASKWSAIECFEFISDLI